MNKEIKDILNELSKPVVEVETINGKRVITRRNYNNTDINKYGRMRLEYLKTHKNVEYQTLIMEDKLTKHLVNISDESINYFYKLLDDFIEKDYKLSQEYKQINQMDWVKNMNYYKNIADEIVINTIVFRDI